MDNLKIEIPDFLTKKCSKEDFPEIYWLRKEYNKRFGVDYCTEGLPMSEEEFADILKICLKENRPFNDVWGTGELNEGDLI